MLSLITHALESVQSRLDRERQEHLKQSRARNKLLAEFGMKLAVKYPREWRAFYRKKAPARIDSEIFDGLLARFYETHRHLEFRSKA